ncbi:MAG: hypothetical protein K8S18_03110 [Desulfobacula sp.]|nr:hypothetical protein [Desulfobacula sp.]
MNTIELTETVNNRIKSLKNEVDAIPEGGGLEILQHRLENIQENIKGFVSLIDDEKRGEE